eukprot:TRINITY_DN3149_c0_g1_i1.p1 TRINITY_DN3149_c0_g1~~TRINITY_DN3149_c0_g1_i1.p1  ORF type:complete len:234 (-),score=45.20 TRINITY_DN3149_c0_g1_i1:134-835(-)
MRSLLGTNTAAATCSSPSDQAMITEKVELLGGFAYVDECIFKFRLESLQVLIRRFPSMKAMLDEEFVKAESLFADLKEEESADDIVGVDQNKEALDDVNGFQPVVEKVPEMELLKARRSCLCCRRRPTEPLSISTEPVAISTEPVAISGISEPSSAKAGRRTSGMRLSNQPRQSSAISQSGRSSQEKTRTQAHSVRISAAPPPAEGELDEDPALSKLQRRFDLARRMLQEQNN